MDPFSDDAVNTLPMLSIEPRDKRDLMSLPRELRDKVYDFTTEHGHTQHAKHSPIPLPVTCFINKQMRSEALARHLAQVRWEFDVRKAPYGKAQLGLLKAWLAALGDDAAYLARFKLICQLKMYRWEVYISLVADGERNGARNVEADERDVHGLWPGAAGIVAFEREGRIHYQAMFPGYRPVVWRRLDLNSISRDGHAQMNLHEEIDEYIREFMVKPLAQKRRNGMLTGKDISTAVEGLLGHKWRCC